MLFLHRATALGFVTLALFVAESTSMKHPPSAVHAAAAMRADVPEQDEASMCGDCHAGEVKGFDRSKMAHSMRLPEREPVGIVRTPEATLRTYSNADGTWQTLESQGHKATYRVEYIIGSGTHASGYLVSFSNHLFQSPVAFYRRKSAYGLAPGYETETDPDFTRPVKPGCLFCHADSFSPISGTINQYAAKPFVHLAIGCNRCHGPGDSHMADPRSSNIVDPAHLDPAARDSVCEQCHLKGVARVLNPGKEFRDYVVGQPLEKTFTIYRYSMAAGEQPPFKVISHSEQLALSRCKRVTGDAMWCGTCHDPHNEPTVAAPYYRSKCLTCHARTHFASPHPSRTSNCMGCHMPKREANDGGHTVFTDHRIQRIPEQKPAGDPTGIEPWRDPPPEIAKRNLGIALIQAGTETRAWSQIVSGYRTLTEIQYQFPTDCEMYNSIGNALSMGHQLSEASIAFEMAARCDPRSSSVEANLGAAYAASGKNDAAEQHLERALDIDPMNLGAAEQLMDLYQREGDSTKAEALKNKIGGLFH